MRITRERAAWGGGALVAAAAVAWVVAPYNIAASVPHLPGVSGLLHGYMHNNVRIRTLLAEPPEQMALDDPALVRLGAAHFASGCAPCHGAPGAERNPVVTEMKPEPTPIAEVEGFGPAGFHWLVANGIKYSGMPAWSGEGRDEEPWALAAFLDVYDPLEPDEYRELAFGEAAGKVARGAHDFGAGYGDLTLTETCARCHGTDGQGRDGTAPKLAGQSRPYLRAALDAYAADTRQSGIMEPAAAPLTPDQRTELAAHYAEMAPFEPDRPSDPALAERGAELARLGDEHADVASCLGCHGEEREATTPVVAGQSEMWLVTWLELWRESPHGVGPDADKMYTAARGLTDPDIRALAAYFASREPLELRREASSR